MLITNKCASGSPVQISDPISERQFAPDPAYLHAHRKHSRHATLFAPVPACPHYRCDARSVFLSPFCTPPQSFALLGIGAACAIALAEAGAAEIALVVRNNASNETYNTLISRFPDLKVHLITADLADNEQVKRIVPEALEKMNGQLHVLVNCAGIQRRAPAAVFPEQDWDDVRRVCIIDDVVLIFPNR